MAAGPSSSSSSLELTIVPPVSGKVSNIRDIDINQVPSDAEPSLTDVGEEVAAANETPRKKLRLTKEQYNLLEESFREHQTLTPKQKEELALQLKLKSRQVEVWYQNRRARTKLKQTEIECEYLKRCFGSLTEENKRLQNEVEQLRALKMAPPTVDSPDASQPIPASTFTMGPHCERVSVTGTIVTNDVATGSSLGVLRSREQPSAAR